MLQFFFTWTLTTSCHCLIKVFIINNKIATSGLRSQYSEKIIISPRHKLKTYKDTLNIFIDVKFSLNENFPFWVVYLELLNVHKRQESRANIIWSRHFLRDVVFDESEIVNRWLRTFPDCRFHPCLCLCWKAHYVAEMELWKRKSDTYYSDKYMECWILFNEMFIFLKRFIKKVKCSMFFLSRIYHFYSAI